MDTGHLLGGVFGTLSGFPALCNSSETQTPILESSKPLWLSLEGRTTYIILFSLPVEGHIVPSHLLAGLIAWAAGPLLWEPDWVWE